MKWSLSRVLIGCWLVLGSLPLSATGRDAAYHELTVSIDPVSRVIHVLDRITLPKFTARQDEVFTLNASFEIKHAAPALERIDSPTPGLHRYRLSRPSPAITLTYGGTLPRSKRNAKAASANQVYLDGADHWLLQPVGQRLTADLTVHLPPGWTAVSQGEPLGKNRWRVEQPHWALHLIGDRYERSELADGDRPRLLTFLRKPNAALSRRYLEKGRQYITWFEQLLGPYPYPAFSVVENRWESGLGMPSFTLLGPRVMRLPFVLDSSYPHEILHNWWGNGIYPSPTGGNWSEGLTTYLADHLVQEVKGNGHRYRRHTLQKYRNYAATTDDRPLNAFRGGHGRKAQAVGYGKALMVFHMLRTKLGDADFVAGLRTLVSRHMFRTASYDDLRSAFEHAAGTPLLAFFRQWTNRPGAPQLALRAATLDASDPSTLRIHLQQVQATRPFAMEIPVAVDLRDGTVAMRSLAMTSREHRTALRFAKPVAGVRIDPAFDVFRRLSRAETPPSLGELFGDRNVVVVLSTGAKPRESTAYRRIAAQWAERYGWQVTTDAVFRWPVKGSVVVLGLANRHRKDVLKVLPPQVARQRNDGSISLASRPLGANHGFAMAGRRGELSVAWIALAYPDTAPELARRLPHYGRYGYAVFEGPSAKAAARGEWATEGGPLARWLAPGRARFQPVPLRRSLLVNSS